jgi:hypothetical protein
MDDYSSRYNIHDAIAAAIAESGRRDGQPVSFRFNTVRLTVVHDSDPRLIHRDFQRAFLGAIPEVGPHPKPELTMEDHSQDELGIAERRRRADRQSAADRERAEELRRRSDTNLAVAPSMDLVDPAAWRRFVETSSDRYGAIAVRFAERWARLIQLELDRGRSFDEAAQDAYNQADASEEPSVALIGAAVAILARCWRHGEALQAWYRRQPE